MYIQIIFTSKAWRVILTLPYSMQHKDPNAPKRPMSGYMFFTQEMRKQLPNMSVTEQAKELGSRWATLTDGQKEVWQALSALWSGHCRLSKRLLVGTESMSLMSTKFAGAN